MLIPNLRSVREALTDFATFGGLTLRVGPLSACRVVRDIRVVRRSELFEANFYLAQRSDLQGVREPARHYVVYGAHEGLDPGPRFSSVAYLSLNPDVATSGRNPLAHFETWGRDERRLTWFAGRGSAGLEAWPLAVLTDARPENLPRYARRPDDAVLVEARRGAAFMSRHHLLDEAPGHRSAIAALNAKLVSPSVACAQEVPDASLIIPVHGQLGYTLNCLDSILSHRSRTRFEIRVVDDASPDESGELLAHVQGINLSRNPTNQGFLRSVNGAAAQGRGRWIIVLNNDIRVVEGWLDALVDTFARSPAAGIVGSKLFYPDGFLQEAGGILWRNASAWNYGRNDDPNRPEYCYARRVDYVSGCSIAAPSALWRDLGGFDDLFAPAYCEDSDLALRIAQAEREVWMQPLSRVIHYEGRSGGVNPSVGVKAYQTINQLKLAERWAERLSAHAAAGRKPELEKERGVRRRALVLDATTPTPRRDAGSVTATAVMRLLRQLDYKVTFAPVDNLLFEPEATGELQAQGVECLYAPYVPSLDDHLARRGTEYDVVHVFRYNVLDRVLPALRHHCPKARILLNNMDVHHLRLERQAALERSPELAAKAKAVKAVEIAAMRAADVVCVPSTAEETLVRQLVPNGRVTLMPYVVEAVQPSSIPFQDRRDIMFLGGFRHLPNVDAALWLAQAIWPLIGRSAPNCRLLIVGADPTPEVRALEKLAGIEVVGAVDDLGPLFERTRAFVAPLRYGAGVKGKIYSAMAHGAPVVSTTLGVEGMDVQPGRDVIVADSETSFANAVHRLCRDPELCQSLAEAGRRFVEAGHSLVAGRRALHHALEAAGAPA